MTKIRRINVSQVEGGNSDSTDTNEIRPFGETAFYLDDDGHLVLMMFDGVRTHLKSKVLSQGKLFGSNADSGDGNGYDTIKLIPDATLFDQGSNQYLVVDPTGGEPGHIHLRAGGTQDQSSADLYLGGELTFVRVSDTSGIVTVRTTNIGDPNITMNWSFQRDGNLYFPGIGNNRIGESEPGLVVSSSDAVVLQSNNNGESKELLFGTDGGLTLPGNLYGSTLSGPGGPSGRVVNITPADDASDKQFVFRIDQIGETFTRAFLDMPSAENDKQVALTFNHTNNTTGYIFTQGNNTVDDGMNNAFNIFYNSGNIKITAMSTEGGSTLRTWTFGNDGNLTLPNSTTVGNDLAGEYSSTFLCLPWGVNDQTSGLFSSNGTAHPIFDPLIATVAVGWFVSGPGLTGVKEITQIVEMGDGDRAFIVDLTDGSLWADLSVQIPYRFYSPDYSLVYNGTRLTVNSNEWNFTQAGNLIIPGNIHEKAGNDLEIAVHNNRNNDGTPGSAVLSLTNNDAVDAQTYTTLEVGAYGIKLNTDYTGVFTGSIHTWEFDRDGTLTLPNGSSIESTAGNGIGLTTDRGTILFGNSPEIGGPSHFHIMKPELTTGVDLYFGDDHNFVLQRGTAYGSDPAYGVEIGASDRNGGSLKRWRFGTDGNVIFPSGSSILDLEMTGGPTPSSLMILGAGATVGENQRAARIALNGDVEGVTIGANDKDWTFLNGNLILPQTDMNVSPAPVSLPGITYTDGTFQTTAWTGNVDYSNITNKPTIATESYVDTAIANLVGTAPAILDTLNELSSALGNNANFATTITSELSLKANITSLANVAFSGDYNDLTNKPVSTVGPTGITGYTGSAGVDGATGPTGVTGYTGSAGFIGPQGPLGPTGATGPTGVTGYTGSAGVDGATGATGATGPVGYTGSAGVDGSVGYTGSKGDTGPVAGSNTQIIFNDNGSAGASANLTFDKNNNTFTVTGVASTGISAIVAGVTNSLLPNTIASFSSTVNSYTQVTLQNKSNGADATADYIITADNGSDTVNFVDLGIINSGYDVNTPTNSLGNIVYAADAYLYAQGNIGTTVGGNLVIGTTTTGKTVKIFAGGNNNNSLVANIASTGISVTGNLLVTGNISGLNNGFALGYLTIPQVSFTNSVSTALADSGKHYYSTSASNLTLTIANNASVAFSIGTALNLVNAGTGTITVQPGSGVTMYLAGNSISSSRSVSSYGMATILKVATDTWFISGTGVS